MFPFRSISCAMTYSVQAPSIVGDRANVVDGRYIFTGDLQQLDRAANKDDSFSWAVGPRLLTNWSEVTFGQVFAGWVFPEVMYP